MFGAPATFILRDVAFQAYLCPAYLRPELRGALEAVKGPQAQGPSSSAVQISRATTSTHARERLRMRGITQTKGMSNSQILGLIESAKARCAWHHADASIKRWWNDMQTRHAHRPAIILHTLEELVPRNLTLSELYEVTINSFSPSVPITMLYLDYKLAIREHQQRRETRAPRKSMGQTNSRGLFDDIDDELGHEVEDG